MIWRNGNYSFNFTDGKDKIQSNRANRRENPWPRENSREVCRIPTLSQSTAWQCLRCLAARGNNSLPQRRLLIFLFLFWRLRLNFSLSRFSFPLICFEVTWCSSWKLINSLWKVKIVMEHYRSNLWKQRHECYMGSVHIKQGVYKISHLWIISFCCSKLLCCLKEHMAFLSQSLKNQSLESSCSTTKESVTWELGVQALTSNSGASASNGNSGTPFLKKYFLFIGF